MPHTVHTHPVRVAIVGSGPAGLGAALGTLESAPDADITLFDPAEPLASPPAINPQSRSAIEEFYDALYADIWRKQKRKFPPPKTHFAATLPKFDVDGVPRVFASRNLGGLSNFWGATCLPFGPPELADWPVDYARLQPFYAKTAGILGISGSSGPLDSYFPDSFLSRPPIPLPPLMQRLEHVVNTSGTGRTWQIRAGVNRVAMETRPGAPRTCSVCGECLAGCFQGTIFSTREPFEALIAGGRIRLVRGRVHRIDPKTRRITLRNADGREESPQPFDLVLLAAGCPNTTEILLRSWHLPESSLMADNAVFVFPILYAGRTPAGPNEYVALNNLILSLAPKAASVRYAQALVYANFDYMWRFNLPPMLWPLARPMLRWSRRRLAWGRLYLDGVHSQAYRVQLEHDRLRLRYAANADIPLARQILAELRTALNREGFHIPALPPVLQKANSHYACTMPYGNRGPLPVAADGGIAPGIHLCDSTVFPNLPAVSLTFTIMANAWRTAAEALGGRSP